MKMLFFKIKGYEEKFIIDTDQKALLMNQYQKEGLFKIIDKKDLTIELLTDNKIVIESIKG